MTIDATLLKQQKNTLLQILIGAKFDPVDFEWQELVLPDHNSNSWMAGGLLEFKVSKLVHRPSAYYVTFGGLNVIYSPGSTQREEREEHHDSWEKRYSSFRGWLSCLRNELDTPDLWTISSQEKALLATASATSINDPFTLAERLEVAAKLEELKQHLLDEQGFRAGQADFIEAQFTYLKEASERLGRKDWLNTALGGLVGLIVGLALDPEKAKGVLAMAASLFQWIWGGTQGLLR